MRRLHVIHYPNFGGPHNEGLRLDAPLRDRGWETTLLLPNETGNAVDRLRAGGVDVVSMSLGRLRATRSVAVHAHFGASFIPQVAAIRSLIRERKIDLVQIGGLVNPHAAVAAKLESVPIVWQFLDSRSPMMLRRALMPVVVRMADVVMTTGKTTGRLHPGLGKLGDRVVEYFPPVDCNAFSPRPHEKTAVRNQWGIADDRPVIGSVGNINPQKGIENLIQALAILKAQGIGAHLILIGAEYDTHRSYSSLLRALVEELDLEEDVIFTGPRNDVETQLQGMDIFMMGSVPFSEGTPTAILEAAACGVPAIATDVGGVRDTIIEDVTGYVVEPQRPEALAAMAKLLLGDVDRLAAASAAARKLAIERYALDSCADTHLLAFQTAIRHHANRSLRFAA